MATQTKTYPIVESAINLFGDWLKHRREMREIRDMNSGDFARMARDICISPAELDAVVRRGPHASDELPRLLKSLGIDEATLSRTQPVLQRDMLKQERRLGRRTALENEPSFNEPFKSLLQFGWRTLRSRNKEFIRELPPDSSAELGNLLCGRSDAVKARDQ